MEKLGALAGGLWGHIFQVNDLAPEVAQLDVLNFEATIGSSTLTQPTPVKIPSDYNFEVQAISGYISSPGDSVANWPLISFNIKEQGKRDIFGTAQSMAQYLNILGPLPPIFFPRSLYLASAGADLVATFARASGWAGANKTVAIQLIGGLVAPNKQRR